MKNNKVCVDCKKPTDKLRYGGELRICDECMNKRIDNALAYRAAEIKATTPPGLSTEALWFFCGILFLVYLFVR